MSKLVVIWTNFLFANCLLKTVCASFVFQPSHYDVTINLQHMFEDSYGGAETFNGSVTIKGVMSQNTSLLQLHAWRMQFHRVKVMCEEVNQPVSQVSHRQFVDDTVTISLLKIVQGEKECSVQIEYGAQSKDLFGLYKSYFPSKYNFDSHFISVTTNNEPKMARLWVPSLDDMSSRASWSITLLHPLKTRVFASSPVRRKTNTDHRKSRFISNGATQPFHANFAVVQEKKFRSDAVHTSTNQTIRFWFPRGIHFKTTIKTLLRETSSFFEYATKLFEHTLDCSIIEIVALQHQTGVSSGCLVVIDHRQNFTATKLREQIVKLWMGSTVLYSSSENGWFHHSLSSYIAMKWDNSEEFVTILNRTVHNSLIFEEPIVPGYVNPRNSHLMYADKGVMLIKMIADVMGEEAFEKMIKSLVAEHIHKYLSRNGLFHTLRTFTEGWKQPACYRAFLGTQTDFVGLPVINVRITNSTVSITQSSYSVNNSLDARYRPWTLSSRWTIPIRVVNNETNSITWLHHDEDGVSWSCEECDRVMIDPFGHGLYLVRYEDQSYLNQLWKVTQDCQLYHRVCLDYSLNFEFCDSTYKLHCHFAKSKSSVIYSATRHKWDDYI